MTNKILASIFAAGSAFFIATPSWAVETNVFPGNETLTTAITNAAPGDVLILQPGGEFSTAASYFTIDKALTLRGVSSYVRSLVTTAIYVKAAQSDAVVIQGLGMSADMALESASDIKVLENEFYGGSINAYSYNTNSGNGTLEIIGNIFHNGGGISNIESRNAYIAGNTLDYGAIFTYVPAWIVGNSITGTTSCPNTPIYSQATDGFTRVIGNRILCSSSTGIVAGGVATLVVGNLVVSKGGVGINAGGYARVYNNTVVGLSGSRSIGINASGEISGNIVTGMASSSGQAISGTGATYNLCYNNTLNNACGTNAITTNPLFVSTTDYHLGTGSPGVDTGPSSPYLADLDTTRNDMGAYGGPWSIAQYDAQRDPQYIAPFVYPLFEVNGLIVGGQLQVHALGVARMR